MALAVAWCGLIQDVRDGHPVERLEAHDLRVDEVGRVHVRLQRRRETHGRALPDRQRVEIARRAVAVERERQPLLAAREAPARDAAVGQLGQRQRLARGRLHDAQRIAPVLVHADEPVGAALGEPERGDVPVGLLDVLVRARRQRVAAHARELAAVVGQVVEVRRRRVERGRAVRRLARVRRDVPGLTAGRAPQIEVGVVGRVRLDQRDPLAVARDAARQVAEVVLEDDGPLQRLRVVAVEIEEARVPLVGADVEGRAIARPAGELGLQLLAWREVLLLAVEHLHVEVVQLVAALVAREQHAIVRRGSTRPRRSSRPSTS